MARRASRWHWSGMRRVGRQNDDDGTFRLLRRDSTSARAMRRHHVWSNLATDRHAIDAQQVTGAIVRLHQRADRVVLSILDDDTRCRASASLELVTDHAGAAADISFGDRAAADCAVERSKRMLLRQWEALDVAEPAIVGLGDDRQMEGLGSAIANCNGRDGVSDDADLVSVGDPDRRAEQALLREPRKAGHFAVAIEREGAGEDVIGPDFRPARPDGGDAGPGNPRVVVDDGRVTHFDARHIGNGVEWSGRESPDFKA